MRMASSVEASGAAVRNTMNPHILCASPWGLRSMQSAVSMEVGLYRVRLEGRCALAKAMACS